jgi:DNA-binding MarR family transcriptional regulator
MIVVFKTGRSPSHRADRDPEGPSDRPITAVETGSRYLIWWITIIEYNLKALAVSAGAGPTYRDCEPRAMTVSKPAVDLAKDLAMASARKEPAEGAAESAALQMGELSELLGYSLKRAQLKVFEDFLRCVAPLQLTPAQFSVLLLLDKNPGRNQTEIATTLGILRPNFVAMLDGLESRDLCARMRSTNDRRSHILVLTDKGRAVLARAKKLVAAKHEARLNELLGPTNRAALLEMLARIAQEF